MDFETGMLEYAVLGIGINVSPMTFPDELRNIATSIGNACGREISRSHLIAEISNHLEGLYPELETGTFMEENRKRSIVIGREITVVRGDETYTARALDIDAQGRLVVRTESGISHVGAGEISLKL